jgi:hypothetical protein
MNNQTCACKIEPLFPPPEFSYFQPLWNSVEILVEQVFQRIKEADPSNPLHETLEECLPIVTWLPLEKLPGLLPIILLSKSHERFANGTGRYFGDALNRFALPGHHLNIKTAMTLDFCFADFPEKKYFVSHIGLMVTTEEEWTALQKNLPKVAEEICITVRAVYEARRIASVKQLNEKEKALLMHEKFLSLWKKDAKDLDLNLFDQVQQWLTKAQAEKNSAKLWKEIAPHIKKEEKIFFDRDMFLEIQTLLFGYRDDFIAKRKTADLARLVCYQYFFKKKLQQDLEKEPFNRHIYLKIFKINSSSEFSLQRALGISIGVNLLNRYELLDVNHILAAIHALVPHLDLIPHSYLIDARHETMRFYYLEVNKKQAQLIAEQEFQLLKIKLSQELAERIESVNHPLFVPFNEETLLKYVGILSKELNKDDMPQVVISFDQQAQDVFSFHAIVLRHVSFDAPALRERLEAVCPAYRWVEEQVKRIPSSKTASCKEAAIIKAVLPKLSFFRKDFSLDLGKARMAISAVLTQAIGEFRDYNGGTAEIQSHAFAAFKQGFEESEGLLLERFFYAIEPAFMQMVINPALLKQGYALFKETIRKEFDADPLAFLHVSSNQGMAAAFASPFFTSTDVLFQKVFSLCHCFPSIAFCSLFVGRIYACVLFYSSPDAAKQNECLQAIKTLLVEKGISVGSLEVK